MSIARVLPAALLIAASSVPAEGQGVGAAGIQQVPGPGQASPTVGVAPVDASRSSATVQSATAEKVPPVVPSKVLAECQAAQAADRPAPRGVDCVRALQVAAAAAANAPTAELSLLNMFSGASDGSGTTSSTISGTTSADTVARQLSSSDFQGTAASDAAASVARDRAPPQSTPPPR